MSPAPELAVMLRPLRADGRAADADDALASGACADRVVVTGRLGDGAVVD